MMELQLAKNKLAADNYTCVVVSKGVVCYTSVEKGIKPLMLPLMQDKNIFNNMVLADKIIGKAAALLVIYSGITKVYADTISSEAKKIFEKNNVQYEYQVEVPCILNRDKTSICPIEKLVEKIDSPDDAYNEIKEFLIK